MKIYKYWIIEKQKILIDGAEQEVTCYGGSNVSVEDARGKAKEKAQKIQRNISLKIMSRKSARNYCKPLTIIQPSHGIAMVREF